MPKKPVRRSGHSKETTPVEQAFYGRFVNDLVVRRIDLGITQEELGQQLGVTESLVAKWETFARLPSAFMLCCWCGQLGLSMTAAALAASDKKE